MEFFLVPLIAISVVTFGIYKLTALIFHIHLSGRLLLLLVVFAWMVSLVLPGLFFQTAGFFGSVGISLVSAVGFAWLATAVDSKRQSVPMTAGSTAGEPLPEVSLWTPPAESAAPVLPKEEWESAPATAEPFILTDAEPTVEVVGLAEAEQIEPVGAEIEPVEKVEPIVELPPVIELEPVVEAKPPEEIELVAAQEPIVELLSPVEPELAVQPLPAPMETGPVSAEDSGFVSSGFEALPPAMLDPDRVSVQDVANISDAFLFEEDEADQDPLQELSGDIAEIATAESVLVTEVPVMVEEPEPTSDSLEDLLEFAFSQRTRNNTTGALVTFRLIRSLYADSQALPMVIAEVVSTLQSQGDYPAAIMELHETIRLPAIQQDHRLVQTFEQKLAYLQVLSALLNERGSPTIPFEQIPTEWHDDIEQGLLAGNRVQS